MKELERIVRTGREHETQEPSKKKHKRRWYMEQGIKHRFNYYKSSTLETFDNL